MLYSSVIVAAALAGFATAQNSTVIPCCSVTVSTVPEDTRQSWCDAQENTCVDLCGGQGDIASNGNTCDASTLDYSCKCSNGTTIAADVMKTYQQTVPAQMCYYWYDACINATIGTNGEGNAAEQFQCTSARDSECGNTTIDDSSSSTSSAASSATGSATRSGASNTAASATSSSTAAASSGAAVALGTPALAAGLLAIFGFAL